MSYITENLLYRPSLSVWTARIKDKAESAKVNQSAGAIDGAANVHKQLLPDSKELEAVQKWATAFRGFIYMSTLPWDDSGWRIGRVVRHMDFMSEVADKIAEGEALTVAFVDAYEQAIENAKFTLNNMFRAADYPGVAEVRNKFRFAIDCQTLPNTNDFRVVDGVAPAEVDRLVEIATNATETKINAAMDEAYARLFGVVSKMATTLEQFGNKDIKKFNDTLTGNIVELCQVMPGLNLTGDPKLAALTEKAERLATYDLKDLRQIEVTRNAAIKEARDLVGQFTTFTRGTDATAAVKPVPSTVVALASLDDE